LLRKEKEEEKQKQWEARACAEKFLSCELSLPSAEQLRSSPLLGGI
jgi:hypothetical protein